MTLCITCETLLEGEQRTTSFTRTTWHTTLEIVAFNRAVIISFTHGEHHDHHRDLRPG